MSNLQIWKAIWQVRFPPSALLFDSRGAIATRWQFHDDLTEWKMANNAVNIHDKDQTLFLNVDARSLSVVAEAPENFERFQSNVSEFTLDTLERLQVRRIERIGLRLIQLESRNSFTVLAGALRRHLYRLSEEEWQILGGYPEDVGFPLVLSLGERKLNWHMGPMAKAQLESIFEAEKVKNRLPEVCLFLDCDLYQEEPKLFEKSFRKSINEYVTVGTAELLKMTSDFVDRYGGFK